MGDFDLDGAGPADTVWQAVQDIDKPEDWAMDGLALGMDALGFIGNPFGTLASAGVGYLIEHLDFLKEPLDDLAGDPKAIQAIAVTWGEDIRKELETIATDYESAVKSEITSWKGDAATKYRESSTKIAKEIRSLSGAATGVSQSLQGSGQLVATVRGIIRDLIADVIGEIIVAAAAAVATSWCSFGASIGAFIGWAVARGAATAGKIVGKISKMLMKLANILNRFSRLRGAVQALAKMSQRLGKAGKSLGKVAGKNGRLMNQVEGRMGLWQDTVKNHVPGPVKNAVDKADDLFAKRGRDGFSDTLSPGNYARTGIYEGAKEEAQADENYDDAKEDAAKKP
ncbi:hypothetical protein [Amycolatopsis minnesotensis]|uniref:WXG100 family type VII secretion target n=1 Tax=Amycolatopsis minnesotensis TaxID=337894 RepID=A0ABP5BS17_9PSEU